MVAINRHRRGGVCPGNMHIDNLEESNGVFIIYFGDKKFNQALLTDADKNYNESNISEMSLLVVKVLYLGKNLLEQSSVVGFVKGKFLLNYRGFVL